MTPRERRDRWFRALEELARPPAFGTNAAALANLGPLARACEWDPEAERPARMRDKYHAPAAATMGKGERSLRVCKNCLHRNAARHYARVAVLQPGRIVREVRR